MILEKFHKIDANQQINDRQIVFVGTLEKKSLKSEQLIQINTGNQIPHFRMTGYLINCSSPPLNQLK